jgi:hypothetical protein
MRVTLTRSACAAACLIAVVGGLRCWGQTAAGQSAAAQAGAAPTAMPSAAQIVDKYVQAIGGKAAWEKITSRISKGTFEMEQMPGDATEEIYAKAPDKQMTITNAPSFVVKRGYNGSIGWEDMPQTGLHDLNGDQLASMKRFSDFYLPIHLDQDYPTMAVKGKETEGGHTMYEIEATPPEGGLEQFYFDVDSGLLLRHVAEIDGPNGKTEFDSNFDDYRTVDGIKLPFVLHQSMGDFSWTIKLTDVQQNVPIDDAKFDKPTPESDSKAPKN